MTQQLPHHGAVVADARRPQVGPQPHRFALTPDGEPGLHYRCAGYKKFFRHVRKYLCAMTTLLENDLPVSLVMQAVDGPLIVTPGAFALGSGHRGTSLDRS